MYTVRGFKRKKRFFSYIFVISFVVILIFLGFIVFSKLRSNDLVEGNSLESIIGNSANDVVGISSLRNNSFIWGSGVVILRNGYILTNEHLLGSDGSCMVWIDSTNSLNAASVWSNSEIDLAIVKVDHTFVSEAVIPENIDLRLGQDVYAIGNPVSQDFEKSVSKGIISGLNRSLEFEENGEKMYLNNLIQIDAATNNGSSGGAIIDKYGQLVGISTIKLISAEGMSFGIPTSFVKPIIEKIVSSGKFDEPNLGLTVYDKYSARKINNSIEMNAGVYVAGVKADSNMEKSGIRPGDIIYFVDDVEAKDMVSFRKCVYEKDEGENVKITIKRGISKYYVQVIWE